MKLLDIGCGNNKKANHIGIDIRDYPNVDIIRDITKGLPFDDDSIDGVFSSHFMEHVERGDVKFVLEEIHRVLKKGSRFELIVPHVKSDQAFMMEHLSYWEKSVVQVLCGNGGSPDHHAKVNFKIEMNERVGDELRATLRKK